MNADNYQTVTQLQIDLIAYAFACDFTRVATLMFNGSGGANMTFPWLGVTTGHHTLAHEQLESADAREKLTTINTWFAQRLAGLATRLNGYAEGGRSVLDSAVLAWSSELSHGDTHGRTNIPLVLLGGAGGKLRTGRLLDYGMRYPLNDLWTTLLQAYGSTATSFGDPAFCTGGLPGLT